MKHLEDPIMDELRREITLYESDEAEERRIAQSLSGVREALSARGSRVIRLSKAIAALRGDVSHHAQIEWEARNKAQEEMR